MVGRPSTRWMVSTGLLLLSIVAVVVLLVVVRLPPRELLAQHLLGQLELASDDLVNSYIRQIEQLDEAGIEALVIALGNSRAKVFQAARSALHRQLDRWQVLPLNESSRRVAMLAGLLAAHVDRFGPTARESASELAVRILRWPVVDQDVDGVQLVTDCETVVRAAANDRTQGDDLHRLAKFVNRAKFTTYHSAIADRKPKGESGLPATDIPGGDLPIAELELPPIPPSLIGPPQPRCVGPDEPDLVPTPLETVPRLLFPEPNEPANLAIPPYPLIQQIREQEQRPTTRNARLSRTSSTSLPVDRMSDVELMRCLHDRDPALALEALVQLQGRGFSRRDISLGRTLTNPDAAVRRQFVESLTNSTLEPGRWLVWASHDPDPTVRMTAVTIMATTRDPTLYRRLSQMLHVESDKKVRGQLERWSRLR